MSRGEKEKTLCLLMMLGLLNVYVSEQVLSDDVKKPVIDNLQVLPDHPYQKNPVHIYAQVTDPSGLGYVKIEVKSPLNNTFEDDMVRIGEKNFKFVFTETTEKGVYFFQVKAENVHHHQNTETGCFEILRDITPPSISYLNAYPQIQLKNKYVKITCVANDNVGINSVNLTIKYPNGDKITKKLTLTKNKEYVYKNIYQVVGVYSYYIKITDKEGNFVTSETKNFWVTKNLNDTDSDGIPDIWEEKYGLDPKNPLDAEIDSDGDSLKNIDEFKIGTNPLKNIFMEELRQKIKKNTFYFTFSTIFSLLIITLSIYGGRLRN